MYSHFYGNVVASHPPPAHLLSLEKSAWTPLRRAGRGSCSGEQCGLPTPTSPPRSPQPWSSLETHISESEWGQIGDRSSNQPCSQAQCWRGFRQSPAGSFPHVASFDKNMKQGWVSWPPAAGGKFEVRGHLLRLREKPPTGLQPTDLENNKASHPEPSRDGGVGPVLQCRGEWTPLWAWS